MRKKWLEKVEFIEKSIPGDGIRKKIIMFNAENGDLYLSVCPENKRGGVTIRIERSGGAITDNPRFVHALSLAYDALADNPDTLSQETFLMSINNRLLCSCGFSFNVEDKELLFAKQIFFCPSCGKKII